MVGLRSSLLLAFLAVTTLVTANPIELDARAEKVWKCKVGSKTIQYSDKIARDTARKAPMVDGGTGSGYPHWFRNGYDKDGKPVPGHTRIKFGDKECDRPPRKTGKPKDTKERFLLEFPVFPNGALYNWREGKPKPNPGPARVIYVYPSRKFCGVIAHEKDNNEGNLVKCAS